MNDDKLNSLIALGAYVKGTFDGAASRGVLTAQGVQTMVNALVAMYGSEEFDVQATQAHNPSAIPNVAELVAKAMDTKTEEMKQVAENELMKVGQV